MTIRFGLLGAGRIGKVHAKAVTGNPAAKLVAVSDAMPAAAQAIADQYGCEVRTIDAIAAAGDIDAVVICTPTDTHADLIEQFVKSGKAVFCEKPIDLSLARVKSCLEVVRAHKGTLMVGFNRRFDPHFQAVRAEIDKGTLGAVEMVVLELERILEAIPRAGHRHYLHHVAGGFDEPAQTVPPRAGAARRQSSLDVSQVIVGRRLRWGHRHAMGPISEGNEDASGG